MYSITGQTPMKSHLRLLLGAADFNTKLRKFKTDYRHRTTKIRGYIKEKI
jgi:hypothetical protein